MNTNRSWEKGTKIIKFLAVTAAVYFGMKFVFPIALPFLIAFVIARLLLPIAKWLERKTCLNKAGARAAAYVLFLAVIGLLAAGLMYLCYRMGSSCLTHLDRFMDQADQMFCACCEKIQSVSGFGMDDIQETIRKGTAGFTDSALVYSKDAGWYLFGLLAKIFVSFIAAFLMLNEYEEIMRVIRRTQAGRSVTQTLHNIKTAAGAYIKAQLIIMGIVTSVCIAGLFLLGTPYAFWAGLAIGICDALPFIGTGTVFVPWAILAVLMGHYQNAAGYLAIYVLCSFIRQLTEPKLVGRKLGVPPLAVLMSIYIGVQVYGGAGVILGPLSGLVIAEAYRGSLKM